MDFQWIYYWPLQMYLYPTKFQQNIQWIYNLLESRDLIIDLIIIAEFPRVEDFSCKYMLKY